MSNIAGNEVKDLYDILGISSKFDEFDENHFFDSNDRHLAWKPLYV